jgi:hypothetical protein
MPTRSAFIPRVLRASALGSALAALSLASGVAQAQFPMGRQSNADAFEVYEWRGRVDSEIRLVLRGNRASVERVGSNETRSGSGRLLRRLPRESGTLRVERLDGRGQVDVVQQPSASNGYTAVVRLRDPSGGADDYRIAAYWRGTGSYADGRTGSAGGAGRRDRDERWERDRRDDGHDDSRERARERARDRDRRDDDRYRVEGRSDRDRDSRRARDERKRDREERKRDRDRDRDRDWDRDKP